MRHRSHASLPLMVALAVALLLALPPAPAPAYVEIPYTLGRLVNESTVICTMRVESVDKAKRQIIFRKVEDLKGKHQQDVIKHVITNGFEPREWQTIMNWAEVGKMAVFMHNGSAGECCIENYWYQIYPGDWWSMSHSEPYLGRSFHGKPEKLAVAVKAMLNGQDAIVPCMVDGDKNALKTGTARVQRARANLKLMDYNPQRDFAGWGGNDDYRKISHMPGFIQFGQLPNVGPGAAGIATADFDGDNKLDICLYGETRTVLLQNGGNTMNEMSLSYSGPSRSAAWGDYNGDGKPDLLLATPAGPRLFTNKGNGSFADDTRGLPVEPYYNLMAAAFVDADGDKRSDILLANGFMGLHLYRNIGPDAPAKPTAPKISKWFYAGPFDNTGQQSFDKVFPPEQGVDLKAAYKGKANRDVKWKEGNFTDGQVNSLAILEDNNDAVVYLYREFDFGAAVDIPCSFGSDDTITVWLNGEKLIAENTYRAAAPDQNQATLRLKPGKNQLLIKICQGTGEFAFYFAMKGVQTPAIPLFEDATKQFNLGGDGIAGHLKGDRLLVADLNGDGKQDVIYSAGKGTVLINTGKGFAEQLDCGLNYAAGGVTPALGDFDGDKVLDLVVPQRDGLKLFKGAGGGRFTDVTATAGEIARVTGNPSSVAFADFKKTGKADLIVGCLKGPNRFFRNVNGKYTDAGDAMGLYGKVYNTRAVYVGDLNNRGVLDVVFNNEGQDSAVLIGDPDKVAVK